MNSEGGRVSQLVESAYRCNAQQALLKARRLAAASSCKSCKSEGGSAALPVGQQLVPRPSEVLEAQNARCSELYTSPFGCVPSSVRTQQLQICAVDAYTELTPDRRFADYRRPYFPPPCPPIPQEALNANVPKMQMTRCPLPNKPDNPVLPG